MTGILDVLFMDIDPANWDVTKLRNMGANSFTKIAQKGKIYGNNKRLATR